MLENDVAMRNFKIGRGPSSAAIIKGAAFTQVNTVHFFLLMTKKPSYSK